MTNQRKFDVVFFQRKRRKNANFSLELIFNTVRKCLPEHIGGIHYEVKYLSNGFFRRIYIMFEVIFKQADINHVTGDIHYATLLLKKKKTILMILDTGFMNHPSKIYRKFLKFFWLTLPLKRVAGVTTISEASKQEILKHANFPPEKIKVVFVPISDRFTYHPQTFCEDKPTILQLGCAPNKNIVRLIEAIKNIPCRLEVVGRLGKAETEKLKEYGIDHHISWNLSNQEVLDKYIQADIISLVSTYEGFGMPIVEGNAVGRAVITSNLLSMPEVAGDAACLVNPYEVSEIRDGVLKIVSDKEYRERLVANGLKNRERFRTEKIASDYAKVYDQLYDTLH